jgi:hypothetical protein
LNESEKIERMVLGGILIEEVIGGDDRYGLRKGDVIVTCKSVHDITMRGRHGVVWMGSLEGEEYEKAMRRSMTGIVDVGAGAVRPKTVVMRGDEVVEFGEK